MAAKNEQAGDDKRVPGIAPDTQLREDPVLGRYPSPPASDPDPRVRADSARAMIEEIVAQRIAEMMGKGNELAAENARRVEESQKAQAERRLAQEREALRKLENLVEYEATATGWVPHPDPRQGGRLVQPGERFLFGGVPSTKWMKAVNGEGERRIKDRAEQEKKLRELRDEDTVALSALDKARQSIERAALGR